MKNFKLKLTILLPFFATLTAVTAHAAVETHPDAHGELLASWHLVKDTTDKSGCVITHMPNFQFNNVTPNSTHHVVEDSLDVTCDKPNAKIRITWGTIAGNKDVNFAFANDKYVFDETTEFNSGGVPWLNSVDTYGHANINQVEGRFPLVSWHEQYVGLTKMSNYISKYVEGIAPTKSFSIKMRGFLDVKDFKFDKEETVNISTPISLSVFFDDTTK